MPFRAPKSKKGRRGNLFSRDTEYDRHNDYLYYPCPRQVNDVLRLNLFGNSDDGYRSEYDTGGWWKKGYSSWKKCQDALLEKIKGSEYTKISIYVILEFKNQMPVNFKRIWTQLTVLEKIINRARFDAEIEIKAMQENLAQQQLTPKKKDQRR
jgi:hypothetical protein